MMDDQTAPSAATQSLVSTKSQLPPGFGAMLTLLMSAAAIEGQARHAAHAITVAARRLPRTCGSPGQDVRHADGGYGGGGARIAVAEHAEAERRVLDADRPLPVQRVRKRR